MEGNNIIKQEHMLPNSQMTGMRMDRFSRIFFNISLTCMILAFVALSSTFVLPFALMFIATITFIIILGMILLTFGTIFLAENNPIGGMWEFLTKIFESSFATDAIEYCMKVLPYITIIGLAISALSILFIALSRKKGWIGRLVAVSIFALVLIIILILYFFVGGKM